MATNIQSTAPDYKNIPHSHRLPTTHHEVQRVFSKLSRRSLIALTQQWLAKKNRDFCRPYLQGDDDPSTDAEANAPYDPAHNYDELLETYKELAARNGSRQELVDRILEGDWRTGISMYQLATAEIQYLLDHPNSLRWSAKRLAKIPANNMVSDMEVTNDSDHLPRFQASTFMSNLSKELTPLMKAHYLLTKIRTMPMTILRVYMHDSPYSTEASLADEPVSLDSAKSVFFIWPNGTSYVYFSIANHLGQVITDDGRHLRDIVLQAIPRAFSRPSVRYQLAHTNFMTKSLDALLAFRGPGRSNAATGGWSIFQDHSFSQNALDFITSQKGDIPDKQGKHDKTSGAFLRGPGRPKRTLEEVETSESKRRYEVARGRFGSSAQPNDGLGLERIEVRIDDPFPAIGSADRVDNVQTENAGKRNPTHKRSGRPSLLDRSLEEITEIEDGQFVPDVRIIFKGTHVFAGIRQLVEQGIIDGEKMPGWMTGEAGATTLTVKDGRVRTSKRTIPGI